MMCVGCGNISIESFLDPQKRDVKVREEHGELGLLACLLWHLVPPRRRRTAFDPGCRRLWPIPLLGASMGLAGSHCEAQTSRAA